MDGWIDGDKNDTERRKADNLFCSVSVRMLLTTDNYLIENGTKTRCLLFHIRNLVASRFMLWFSDVAKSLAP